MADFPKPLIETTDLAKIPAAPGTLALIVAPDGALDRAGRRVARQMRGALQRFLADERFKKASASTAFTLDAPGGMAADRLVVVKLDRRAAAGKVRIAGGAIAAASLPGRALRVEAGSQRHAQALVTGMALRSYSFAAHKTADDADPAFPSVTLAVTKADGLDAAVEEAVAVAAGVRLARDLTNQPANVLTTAAFAAEAEALSSLGVEVEVLEEAQMETLGMRLLLGVGQGSAAPSKIAVMRWQNDGPEAPLALVGKGVVFDTGGISLKPPAGMEEMTMDMAGAAVVVGAMKALAGRRARAHVIGVIGLVENMPDGMAQRPGDVVASMKGDTVEIINTDAEGRLVLADALWYTQDRFKPSAIIDLATLTGAIIVALGEHNAGAFCNDDDFWAAFETAAATEAEPVWRMPLGTDYADALKSRVADVANVGGRPGGAAIAAEFLHRFIEKGTPWIHLDIAGVAMSKKPTALAPAGATGWGVLTLDRLVRDMQEG